MPFLKDGTWKNACDMTPGDYEDEEVTGTGEDSYPDYLPDNYDPDPDPEED